MIIASFFIMGNAQVIFLVSHFSIELPCINIMITKQTPKALQIDNTIGFNPFRLTNYLCNNFYHSTGFRIAPNSLALFYKLPEIKKAFQLRKAFLNLAVWTGLEPATPCVTGMYSNQLNYQTCFIFNQKSYPQKWKAFHWSNY